MKLTTLELTAMFEELYYEEWVFGDVQYFDLDGSPALDSDYTGTDQD